MQISRRFESHNSSIILNAVRKEKEAYLPFFDIGFLLTDRGRAPCYLDISRGRGRGEGGGTSFVKGIQSSEFSSYFLRINYALFFASLPMRRHWRTGIEIEKESNKESRTSLKAQRIFLSLLFSSFNFSRKDNYRK